MTATRGRQDKREVGIPGKACVCLHLTSLPGPFGIGEIGTAAKSFVLALKAMGVGVWQFLPLGPTAFGNSPYQSLSAFAGNELLIDVRALVDDGLLSAKDVAPLASLPQDRVDFGRLIPAKASVLEAAAANFDDHAGRTEQDAFDAFRARVEDDWLNDYASFRVLKRLYAEAPWPRWERRHRRRYVRALSKLAREHGSDIRRVKILQYLFDRQWSALKEFAASNGVLLFGDMPIYVAADSADAWSRPELLQMDRDGSMQAVAGVPPDYFGAEGQFWGNPLYRWRRHRRDDFAWWAARLRHATTLADLARIDHFRGFEAFWSIPAGSASARDGHWVRGPGSELFDKLEHRLGHLPVVAEDLGEITPAVTALRRRFGIPGMAVLQFAMQDERFDPGDIVEDCVCYTGTHDNNTTIGWFAGDGKLRGRKLRAWQSKVLELTGGTARSIHHDLFRLALGSPARIAAAPLQDILGLDSRARMNTPGTSRGNWRWRFRERDLTGALCEQVRGMVAASGRALLDKQH